MNYKMIISILGKTFVFLAVLLIIPMAVGFLYSENSYLSYLIPIAGLLAIGLPVSLIKVKDKTIYAREGFVIVALVWVIFSLVGALPFVISSTIPNYVDALFETVSGFTTTGATILPEVESMQHSFSFWRCFTHWIGGMGVLVFVLALLPSEGGVIHIFRAESPGPTASKFVSKMKFTARILYGIYIALSIVETVMLLCGGMNLFDSVIHTFSTAGTGGFGSKNASIMAYNSVYIEMVIAVFMFIFSVNFNVFYLMLIGNFKKAFKCEELRAYFIIVVLSTLIIALNILSICSDFGQALRYSFFQVTSISSTTGFMSTNFDTWPALSKSVLLFLMIVGACAGSTGGGIKVSRIILLTKSSVNDVKKMVRPRTVTSIKFEGESVDSDTIRNTKAFLVIWVAIVIVSTILVSADAFVGGDVLSSFTATLTCIGNVGPGLNLLGPTCNFGGLNGFSKIWLSFVMLAGRLEIFPVLMLFSPKTWKRN